MRRGRCSSPEAREFARQFTVSSDGYIDPDVILGSARARVIEAILERVLGTGDLGIFGGILTDPCTGTVAYDALVDIPCDRPRAIGEVLIWQVQNAARNATNPWGFRYLTEGEKKLAKDDNGMDIKDVDEVRVHNGTLKLLGLYPVAPGAIIAPNGHIYIGSRSALTWSEDYAPLAQRALYTDDQKREQGILLHELTHVWQNRNKGCIMVCMMVRVAVAHLSGQPYVYWPELDQHRNKPFLDFGLEKQAQMAGDRYLLFNGLDVYPIPGNAGANLGDKSANYGVVDTVVDQVCPTAH